MAAIYGCPSGKGEQKPYFYLFIYAYFCSNVLVEENKKSDKTAPFLSAQIFVCHRGWRNIKNLTGLKVNEKKLKKVQGNRIRGLKSWHLVGY